MRALLLTVLFLSAFVQAGDAVSLNGDCPVNFDGQTHIDYGDLDILDGAGVFTITAWVRPDMDFANTSQRPIITKTNTCEAPGGTLVMVRDNGAIKVFLEDEVHHRLWLETSAGVVSDDQWYHVAVVFDGGMDQSGRVLVYVNGVEQSATWIKYYDPFTATISTDTSVQVGSARLGGGGCHSLIYKGDMGRVTIFDSALDAATIDILYSAGR